MRDTLKFFAGFLKNPFAVGSVVPSSRALADQLIEGDAFRDARSVVEVGAGTGAITGVILSRLRDRSSYLGVDLNPEFVAALAEKYPGARFVCDSVEKLPFRLQEEKLPAVDFVCSGLPWTLLPEELQVRFLEAILASLADGGMMVTFIYLHMLATPQGNRFLKIMRSKFAQVERSPVVWVNIPPAVVFRCRK